MTPAQRVTNYFFALRGWDFKDPKYKPIYSRWVGVATRELLPMAGGDPLVVKEKIDSIRKWAESKNLDWNLGTVAKRWLEVNEIEKKPFTIEGDPLVQTSKGWMLKNWDGQLLNYVGSESDIVWK